MKTKKFFNFIRFIAIAAIVCTIIVSIVMMVESAMPGDESAEQSNQVANNIKDTFDIKDENVKCERVRLGEVKGFAGEEYALDVKFFPNTATDTEVTYSCADENIAEVSEDGTLTLKSAGTTDITVALKSDPSVKHTASMTCYGTHPSKITSVHPYDYGASYMVGKTKQFDLKDQDGNKLLLIMFNAENYDDSVINFSNLNILPLAEGETTMTLTIKSGLGKKDYEQKTFENAFTIAVEHNPDFICPEDVTLVNDGVYEMPVGAELHVPDLVTKVLPEGANKSSLIYGYSLSSGVVKELVGAKMLAAKAGEVQVKIYSKYNPDLVKYATVRVFRPKPDSLSVTGVYNRRAQTDKKYKLSASFDGIDYADDVTWSVVKGKANISEKGVLSDMKLGKLTVRATYKDDPSLYVDYEINCVLFEDFALSMRKLIGHFLLFAVIGFGLAYSFVFLIKPRLVALPLSLAGGFGLAAISEALQLPTVTTGRYAAWSDVLIDFLGSALGIAVAFILLGIILLAFRLSKSRGEFSRAFSAVSAKTMFRSTKNEKVQALLDGDAGKKGRSALAENAQDNSAEEAASNEHDETPSEGKAPAPDKQNGEAPNASESSEQPQGENIGAQDDLLEAAADLDADDAPKDNE